MVCLNFREGTEKILKLYEIVNELNEIVKIPLNLYTRPAVLTEYQISTTFLIINTYIFTLTYLQGCHQLNLSAVKVNGEMALN